MSRAPGASKSVVGVDFGSLGEVKNEDGASEDKDAKIIELEEMLAAAKEREEKEIAEKISIKAELDAKSVEGGAVAGPLEGET